MTTKTYNRTIKDAADEVHQQARANPAYGHGSFLNLVEVERILKRHFPPPLETRDDITWGTEDKMIFLTGKLGPSYRCDCGCNVFRQAATDPMRYKCNSCGTTFTGE